MEDFPEEHSKALLSKEWLVKIDNQSSTPYLMKFYSSSVDLSCCILITDTRRVWTELLSSKQFARRWRTQNECAEPAILGDDEEEAWRLDNLDHLSRAHAIGDIGNLAFEVVQSKFADFAIELRGDALLWRWETTFVGHKMAAEILSKHLILPLISMNHLAYSSNESVSNLSDSDLEKAVDKVGRTARRTTDIHIRNALSKPRVATTLRRMTAVFNFVPELPSIISNVEPLEMRTQFRPSIVRTPSPPERLKSKRSSSPNNTDGFIGKAGPSPASHGHQNPRNPPQIVDSATESEQDEEDGRDPSALKNRPDLLADPDRHDIISEAHPASPQSRHSSRTPNTMANGSRIKDPVSSPDPSPPRPHKKAKPPRASSDDDSEEERRKRAAQIKSGTTTRSGTRQPIKRGGKRF